LKELRERLASANPLTACDAVCFSLFCDLIHDFSGRVERMLGPIVFAHWSRRRRPFCGRLLGLRNGGQALPLLLDHEKAAEDQRDQDYDSGSHGTKSEQTASQGDVAARMR
jgi:hypothetical protein